jgi:hypothetical protein
VPANQSKKFLSLRERQIKPSLSKFLVQSVTVEIKIIAAYKIKESLLESGATSDSALNPFKSGDCAVIPLNVSTTGRHLLRAQVAADSALESF